MPDIVPNETWSDKYAGGPTVCQVQAQMLLAGAGMLPAAIIALGTWLTVSAEGIASLKKYYIY